MSIPDAPWIGMCKDDYYSRYDDEEDMERCDHCGELFYRDEMIETRGQILCERCCDRLYGEEDEEEEEDEELHG